MFLEPCLYWKCYWQTGSGSTRTGVQQRLWQSQSAWTEVLSLQKSQLVEFRRRDRCQ